MNLCVCNIGHSIWCPICVTLAKRSYWYRTNLIAFSWTPYGCGYLGMDSRQSVHIPCAVWPFPCMLSPWWLLNMCWSFCSGHTRQHGPSVRSCSHGDSLTGHLLDQTLVMNDVQLLVTFVQLLVTYGVLWHNCLFSPHHSEQVTLCGIEIHLPGYNQFRGFGLVLLQMLYIPLHIVNTDRY